MKYAQKAADDLKSFMKKFQPLTEVVKILEEAGSLDNAVEEVKKAKLDADKVLADAVSKKEKALFDLKKAQDKVDESYKLAKDYEQNAVEKAQKILADAKEAAHGIEQVAFEKLQKVEAMKLGFATETQVLQQQVEAKKLELSELQSKVEEIKARLANFIK